MKKSEKRSTAFMLAGFVIFFAAACTNAASQPSPTSTPQPPEPTATDVPDQQQVMSSDADPTPTYTPTPYDPNRIMYRLFAGFGISGGPTTDLAIREVLEQNDVSQVPVMIEMMRFLPSTGSRENTAAALRQLTGQSFGGEDWREWMEWYGNNSADFRPPEEYLEWKISLLGEADRGFIPFLSGTEETARIDYTELVWGGVPPDGIPDLRNPPNILPDEATYLEPDERVFGVEINGESRAYPLRIVNAHEMANDVLGGEPFALSW